MRTYALKKRPGLPLYEALYRAIREDILSGALPPGEKLPSKRALAANLEVGKTTVEAAYAQLLEEGFIVSRERSGYFVEANLSRNSRPAPAPLPVPQKALPAPVDLTGNGTGQFPFSVWIRLQREVILDLGPRLLLPLDSQGAPELRQAIAESLGDFRGLSADPENILIGAGTDFLYNLLLQLLGQDKVYGVEDPGYGKIRKIYAASGVRCLPIPMDDQGIRPDCLGNAQVLHISPSHHFPTGIVTPMARRKELLDWAETTGGWIIEDDYDTEFRFRGRPLPTMQAMDPDRVIYMNTFSKTLAPSIRISYMVLPPALMRMFRRKLGFYGCTVPSFEQYTLARFLNRGYFEKHINRMRKFYRARRNRVIDALEHSPMADRFTILEKDAGLHFLLQVDTDLSGPALARELEHQGLRVQPLSSFYTAPTPESEKSLVINYSAVDEDKLRQALERLRL
ncbi:MAG: PLP-dependent aminotransferase family protein [Candidatus Faecousia sp.]|nr:PLP-dependent aminotransferase family protein [Candidatus Faecousia sp.]